MHSTWVGSASLGLNAVYPWRLSHGDAQAHTPPGVGWEGVVRDVWAASRAIENRQTGVRDVIEDIHSTLCPDR